MRQRLALALLVNAAALAAHIIEVVDARRYPRRRLLANTETVDSGEISRQPTRRRPPATCG